MFELLNLLSKLTLSRAANLVLVVLSYYGSRVAKRPLVWGKAVSMAFEPTTACNLRCPECPSGLRAFTRPTGFVSPKFFRQTIDQVRDHLIYLTFYFQGEPYLHPDFLSMVKYASDRKIFTSTSTNAHFLDDDRARKTIESGLSRLIISVDGINQETYSQYRVGGKLAKVLAGIRNLIIWKKKRRSRYPQLVLQFLVLRSNQDQIQEMKELGRELGVDRVVFKTAQIYDYRRGSDIMPTIDKYSRYRVNGSGEYRIKNKLRNHCWKMWHSNVATWDGKIVPCCFDKDARHLLGDVGEQPYSEVWTGKRYQDFRQKVLTSRREIDICSNCSEGTSVWL